MTGTLFVDLDDTLLLPGRFSRTLWRLARFFQMRGRARQRPNPAVLDVLRRYERVVVLTSRDDSDRDETLRMLARHGIEVSGAAFCPRREVFREWKGRKVSELAPDGPVFWMDDLFDRSGPRMLRLGTPQKDVMTLPVPTGGPSRPSGGTEPPGL